MLHAHAYAVRTHSFFQSPHLHLHGNLHDTAAELLVCCSQNQKHNLPRDLDWSYIAQFALFWSSAILHTSDRRNNSHRAVTSHHDSAIYMMISSTRDLPTTTHGELVAKTMGRPRRYVSSWCETPHCITPGTTHTRRKYTSRVCCILVIIRRQQTNSVCHAQFYMKKNNNTLSGRGNVILLCAHARTAKSHSLSHSPPHPSAPTCPLPALPGSSA